MTAVGPLVSIVMPCFNVAGFIEYALMSIHAQSYRNYEIIIVDDDSRDNTGEISNRYTDRLPIRYFRLNRNLGISGALNFGLSKCQGKFIARFDPDDYMLPFRLTDQVNFFLEHPEVKLLGGGARLFGFVEGEHQQRSHYREIIDEFLLNNPFIHPTVMFHRELYDEGLYRYNESLTNEEDYELWARLIPKIRCHNLHYPIIRYRLHGHNGQRNPGKKMAKKMALATYLAAYGVNNDTLVHALAEYQCSGYFSASGFDAVRAHALKANKSDLPAIGWLQNWIVREPSYLRFMEYS